MAKIKIKHTITKKEWNKKHKDFKTTIDGVPYIMMYNDKVGTYLTPVKIVEATDAEEQEFHSELDKLVHKTFGKSPEEKEMDEKMDMNDPILVKLRAAQMRKNKQAAKKIDTEKQNKNATKIKALKKKRAEVMRDMEQEAEPEGGKIADRYGKLLNKIDNDIIKLGGNPMSESVNEGKDFKRVKKDKYGNHLEPQFKKGDKVKYLGNKAVITRVNKESNGVYSYDVDYYKGNGRTKASNIFNKDGKTIQLESVNEAYIVTYAKKKGEKPASAAFQLRGSALSFERDLKKDGYITMVTQKKVKGVDESINEWKLQLDLGKVNPSEFEKWADSSLQKKHKIKVSGSGKNWTIVGKGNDDRMGSSADWITQLLGKAYKTNKIKVVQKESVNENDGVYFKSYTAAIEAARAAALKKGFVVDDDEMFTKVGMNSKRPSVGKTTRVSLELTKNGKPQRKMLHIQVYGMKNGYELNSYIN